MNRTVTRFAQTGVARAIRGAIRGGLNVTAVEIDADGKIVVLSGNGQSRPDGAESPDDFERRLREGTGWAK